MAASRRAALRNGAAAGGAVLVTALAIAAAAVGTTLAATGSSGCTASGHIDTQWGSGSSGGEVVTVTVANTATTTGTKWTVGWTFDSGQRIVSAWNAGVSASGATATAVNAPYNGKLAPGASTTFGMQLAGTGTLSGFSCVNDAVGSSPTGSVSTSPATGGDVNVTVADNNKTVTLLVGQTLGVSLDSTYRVPTVTGSGLVQLSATGGTSSSGTSTGQPMTALYRAAATGSVDLSSVGAPPCVHDPTPCPGPETQWTLHVNIVTSLPTGGQTVTVSTADNLSTVSLHVGDTLVVSLNATYDPPKLSVNGVLTAGTVTGGYPTTQPLNAQYVATAAGQVDVSTATDAACFHQPTPCPSPAIPWKVHVTVAS
jgi:cellulose binding protein with CBM2 domain